MSQPPTATLGGQDSPNQTAAPPIASPLVAPIDNSASVVAATGFVNQIDPLPNYANYRLLEQFTWSTSDLPGTKLFVLPIRPSNMDAIHRYQAKLYLTWAGSYDFALQVAGTGFNGGKLIVTYLPPQFTPEKIQSINQFDCTAFPVFIVDPKQLPPAGFSGPDINKQLFHENLVEVGSSTGTGQYDSSSVAGYFVVTVLNTLVSSSPENSILSCNVFFRMSTNFKFAILCPPALDLTPQFVPPEIFPNLLLDPGMFQAITHMRIGTEVVAKNLLHWRAGLNKEGDDIAKPIRGFGIFVKSSTAKQDIGSLPPDLTYDFSEREWAAGHIPEPGDTPMVHMDGTPVMFARDRVFAMIQPPVPMMLYQANSTATVTRHLVHITKIDFYNHLVTVDLSPTFGEDGVVFDHDAFMMPAAGPTTCITFSDSLPWSESFTTFHNEKIVSWNSAPINNQGWLAPFSVMQACFDGVFRGLSLDQTPVYTVNDNVTGEVLAYLRLNRKGFFTSTPVSQAVFVDLSTVNFKFSSIISENIRLPSVTTSALTYLYTTSKSVKRTGTIKPRLPRSPIPSGAGEF